jgi:hypothetical protein
MRRVFGTATWVSLWLLLTIVVGFPMDRYLRNEITDVPFELKRYWHWFEISRVGWTVLGVGGIGALVLTALGWRGALPGTRTRRIGDCPHCGYDCTSIWDQAQAAAVCPECGRRLSL